MARPILDPEHEETAREAAEFGLCEHCLGRCFAYVDHGLGNDERGRMLADAWDLEPVEPAACHICEGLFARIERMTAIVEEDLSQLEFESFLVGTRVATAIEEREETIWAAIGAEDTESASSELNREIGKRLVMRHTGPGGYDWDVAFERPNVTAVLDTRFDHVEITYRSIFLYSRYRKHSRELPQTRWPCRTCRGSGCHDCDRTGKTYQSSVEALVVEPAKRAAGATEATFHGAGREDVDARMVGTGRPFVIELHDPARRWLNLDVLQRAIDAYAAPDVDIDPLRFVPKDAVQRVKQASGSKTYEAHVAFQAPVPTETLKKACRMLQGTRVAQRTPNRVSHRRADKTRHRTVARCRVRSRASDGLGARLLIQGDAGLYIKELVSGDGGRTEPSLADLVGTEAVCEALDVVAVEGPDGFEDRPPHPPTE